MVHSSDDKGNNIDLPAFANVSPDFTSIWGAVFEKALAKMKGFYLNSELIGNNEATNYLTGFPSIAYYSPANLTVNSTFFSLIQTAIQN